MLSSSRSSGRRRRPSRPPRRWRARCRRAASRSRACRRPACSGGTRSGARASSSAASPPAANSLRAAARQSSLNSRSVRMKVLSSPVRAGLLELPRQLAEALALVVARPPRGAARHQPLELAAHLEQPQLRRDVDLRHHHAAARQDRHQALAREPLQRLADRRAPDAAGARRASARTPRSPGASWSVTISSSISV